MEAGEGPGPGGAGVGAACPLPAPRLSSVKDDMRNAQLKCKNLHAPWGVGWASVAHPGGALGRKNRTYCTL